MEEEKIKEEILKEEIQNEILVPGVSEPTKVELGGEQKKKQWEKCMEGLARHRAIKKKQTEEQKLRKAQEKAELKQKIREELEKEKLKAQVLEETQKGNKKDEFNVSQTSVLQEKKEDPSFAEYEQFLQWKKSQSENSSTPVIATSGKPEKKKAKKRKVVQIEVSESSNNEESDAEEEPYIPRTYYEKYHVEQEEAEEKVARARLKETRKLPPRANLERNPRKVPTPQTDSQLYYQASAPGKYFYL